MTLSNLAKHLFGCKQQAVADTAQQGNENGLWVVVSEESNNWNKFALLVSIEGEKLPSERRSSWDAIKTFQRTPSLHRHELTTTQWNELALTLEDKSSRNERQP